MKAAAIACSTAPPPSGPIRSWMEAAKTFKCEDETLVGVIATPTGEVADTGVLIIVGGPQYRAGSHRSFVTMARALATAGWPVLRFDVRGMGDSGGSSRSFEEITPDIGVAIDAFFASTPGLRRVVLWGLCDAASAALLYLDERRDSRVCGLVLLNPWVRAAQTFARAQVRQYYARRLLNREFWMSLLVGRLRLDSVRDFLLSLRLGFGHVRSGAANNGPAEFPSRMARAWGDFGGHTLLILSGRDLTAREFVERLTVDPLMSHAAHGARVVMVELPDADHVLSNSRAKGTMIESLLQWLDVIKRA